MKSKRSTLEAFGYVIGARDPRINTSFQGRFMVVETHSPAELPTQDGSNGPWAIVGDDLDLLIGEAFDRGPHTHEDTTR